MASILRVKLRWTIPNSGVGYSVFHFRDFASGLPSPADAVSAVQRVDTFITNLLPVIPNPISLQTIGEVEVIEEINGDLIDFMSASPAAAKTGTAGVSSFYMAAVGAVITWRTNGVRNGRRIRGRTFLVPLSGGAFDLNGTLNPTATTTINTAASNLAQSTGSPDLGVWARPSAPGANDGEWTAITGWSIPDVGAVLRSRRD